jgi:hypothetical protein
MGQRYGTFASSEGDATGPLIPDAAIVDWLAHSGPEGKVGQVAQRQALSRPVFAYQYREKIL